MSDNALTVYAAGGLIVLHCFVAREGWLSAGGRHLGPGEIFAAMVLAGAWPVVLAAALLLLPGAVVWYLSRFAAQRLQWPRRNSPGSTPQHEGNVK